MAALESQAKANRVGPGTGGAKRFKRAANQGNNNSGSGGGGGGAAYLEMVRQLQNGEQEDTGGGKWLVR